MIHVLSISGGKDSTALWIWALREGLSPLVPVFCDTKWEAAETYAYLDYLEARLGPLRRVSSEGFAERTQRTGTFPSRIRKWCTPELKTEMCAAELVRIREEMQDETDVLIGFRREEGGDRADETVTPAREWSDAHDCEVWRPILDWTLQDVIDAHHQARVNLNPLYLLGAERVGCWPCIHARKSEIRLIADHDPARIEQVAALERAVGQTMFVLEAPRGKGQERRKYPADIHEVVAWSRTARGGKVLAVLPEPRGCKRWGTCEMPREG